MKGAVLICAILVLPATVAGAAWFPNEPPPSYQECENLGHIRQVEKMLENLQENIEPTSPEQSKYLEAKEHYTLAHAQYDKHTALLESPAWKALATQSVADLLKAQVARIEKVPPGRDQNQQRMWLTLHAMTLNSALEPIWDRYLPYIKNPVKADNPFDNYIPALVDDELSAYVGCWGERGAAAR